MSTDDDLDWSFPKPDIGATPTIGSTDAAILLDPRGDPWRVWPRVVGLLPRYETTDDPSMRRGRRLESALGAWYQAETHCTYLTPGPTIAEAPRCRDGWAHAREDFTVEAADRDETRVVECKTARRLTPDWGWTDAPNGVPVRYAAQCLWLAWVHDVAQVDVAAFGTLDDEFRIYALRPSEALLVAAVRHVRNWYERHVLEGEPPPHTGSAANLRTLAQMTPNRTRERREATVEDFALARDCARLSRQIKALEAEKAKVVSRLCASIGEVYGLKVGTAPIASWAPVRGRRTIDTDRLRKDYPDIAEAYTKTGPATRRFLLEIGDIDEETP